MMRSTLFVAVLVVVAAVATLAQAPLAIEWSRGPNMPAAVAGGATGIIGEKLIVAGGTFWHTMQAKLFVSWTQLYDLATGTWSMGPDLPRELAYTLTVVVGGEMYLFGGYGQDRVPVADGYILTPVTNPEEGEPGFEWSRGPALPEPLGGVVGGVVDSVIYAVGGSRNSAWTQMSNALHCLDTSDPDAGWKTLAPMPGPPTSGCAATTCGGNLYLFGGYRTNGEPDNVDDAYRYDVAQDRWTRIRRLPVRGRAQTALAYDDRYILIFGPYINSAEDTKIHGSDHGNSAAVIQYDTQEDTYAFLQPMPFAVVEIYFALKGNVLYGVGGEHLFKIRSPYLFIGKVQRLAVQ